jgi:hypothetical protein
MMGAPVIIVAADKRAASPRRAAQALADVL